MSQSLDIVFNVKANTQQANQEIQNTKNLLTDSSNPNLAYETSKGGIITSSSPVTNPQNPIFQNQNQNQKDKNILLNESINKLSETTKKMNESFNEVIESLNIFNQNLKNSDSQQNNKREDLSKTQKKKDEEEKSKNNKKFQETNAAISIAEKIASVINGWSKGQLAYTQQAITGDVAGANLTKNDSINNTVKGVGGLMVGAGTMLSATPVGLPLLALGGLTTLTGSVMDYFNDRKKEDHAYAQQYKQALPQLTSVSATFGGEGVRNKTAQQNANDEIRNWSRLNKYNRDTGMENAAFTQLATSFGQHGITNLDVAGNMAQQSAKWARFTGGDASQFADFMGKMTRYGSKNAVEDVGYAYSAAKNSGLNKNQMPEFLRGLQSVIEDGISKGYVRSTKDVADTLSMFGKMSGGHASWTGQQGANKLMTMNAGLANATNLSSPAHLLAYRAFAGKDTSKEDFYLEGAGAYNTFALMEKGAKAGNVKDVIGSVQNAYGDDIQQQIEAIKQIYGLNNAGAMELLKFSKSGNFSEEGAKKIVENADLQNNETKMYNALSKINDAVVNLGKSKFELELKDTDKYLLDIYKLLDEEFNKDKEQKKIKNIQSSATDKKGNKDFDYKEATSMKGNGYNELVVENGKYQIQSQWSTLTTDDVIDTLLANPEVFKKGSYETFEKYLGYAKDKNGNYEVDESGNKRRKSSGVDLINKLNSSADTGWALADKKVDESELTGILKKLNGFLEMNYGIKQQILIKE